MEESAIAARLAATIPREPAVEAGTAPVPVRQPGEEGYIFDSPLSELDHYRLQDYFNIPSTDRTPTSDANKYLSKLVEWAAQSGAVQYHEVIARIRELQRALGSEDLSRLYRYVRIDATIKGAEAEMRNLYGA